MIGSTFSNARASQIRKDPPIRIVTVIRKEGDSPE